jgi:hypothetical protein
VTARDLHVLYAICWLAQLGCIIAWRRADLKSSDPARNRLAKSRLVAAVGTLAMMVLVIGTITSLLASGSQFCLPFGVSLAATMMYVAVSSPMSRPRRPDSGRMRR